MCALLTELWESIKRSVAVQWVIICSHKLYTSELTSAVCVCNANTNRELAGLHLLRPTPPAASLFSASTAALK